MNNTTQKVTQTARTAAVDLAKKVASENLRVFETAKAQLGLPVPEQGAQQAEATSQTQPPNDKMSQDAVYEQMKAQSDQRSRELLQQLESELKRIREERQQRDARRAQQEAEAQTQAVYAKQEEVKKETKLQKAMKGIKSRISGKREMQKNAGG
jgi:hypothetical protein